MKLPKKSIPKSSWHSDQFWIDPCTRRTLWECIVRHLDCLRQRVVGEEILDRHALPCRLCGRKAYTLRAGAFCSLLQFQGNVHKRVQLLLLRDVSRPEMSRHLHSCDWLTHLASWGASGSWLGDRWGRWCGAPCGPSPPPSAERPSHGSVESVNLDQQSLSWSSTRAGPVEEKRASEPLVLKSDRSSLTHTTHTYTHTHTHTHTHTKHTKHTVTDICTQNTAMDAYT